MNSSGARILVVEDDESIASLLQRDLTALGYQVEIAEEGNDGLQRAESEPFDLVLSDLKMAGLDGLTLIRQLSLTKPRLPIILMTAFGTTDAAINATKLGAFDFLCKPFEMEALLKMIRRARQETTLDDELVTLDQPLGPEHEIIGKSRAMQSVFKEIGRLAPRKVTVLIRGETGTGKELVARALHRYSDRDEQPFVAVNCMAIPEALLESELFGHERGAFTGAVSRRAGRFEQAHRGTLFLDEIGDISLNIQGKLYTQAFRRAQGNQSKLARWLGVSRPTIQQKIQRYGLTSP